MLNKTDTLTGFFSKEKVKSGFRVGRLSKRCSRYYARHVSYRKTEYSRFYYVRDLIASHEIRSVFADSFPMTCVHCGHELVINHSKTVLKCGNPNCSNRIAMRCLDMFKTLGSFGMGPSFMLDYVKSIKAKSVISVLNNPPSAYALMLREYLDQPKDMITIMKFLNLPRLKGDCEKIFKHINSFDAYAERIESEGYEDFVMHQMGFSGDSGEKRSALNYAETLRQYSEEIEGICKRIPIEAQATNLISIVITGHIRNCTDENGEPYDVDAYVEMLNKLGLKCNIRFKNGKSRKSAPFIVADMDNDSTSYREGKRRNVLITSDKLLAMVHRMVEGNTVF